MRLVRATILATAAATIVGITIVVAGSLPRPPNRSNPARAGRPPDSGGGARTHVGDPTSASPRALTVRIVGTDGAPVAYASVNGAFVGEASMESLPTAHADAAGIVTLKGVRRGTYDLRTSASGFSTSNTSIFVGADGADVTVELSRAGHITGEVRTESGAPAAACAILALGPARLETSTRGDGCFYLDVRPGEYELTAQCGRRFSTARRIRVVEGDESRADLVLDARLSIASIHVRAADTLGSLPGARVTVTRGQDYAFTGTTAPDGNVTPSPLPPGRYQVMATARGYSPAVVEATVQEDDPAPRVALELRPAGRVRATVLLGSGSASECTVRIEASGVPWSSEAVAGNASPVASFTDVPAGQCTIYARCRSGPIVMRHTALVSPGAETRVSFAFDRYTPVLIQVRERDGTVPDEPVTLSIALGYGPMSEIATAHDAQLRMDVPSGTYVLAARRSGTRTTTTPRLVELRGDREVRAVVSLDPPPAPGPPENAPAAPLTP